MHSRFVAGVQGKWGSFAKDFTCDCNYDIYGCINSTQLHYVHDTDRARKGCAAIYCNIFTFFLLYVLQCIILELTINNGIW